MKRWLGRLLVLVHSPGGAAFAVAAVLAVGAIVGFLLRGLSLADSLGAMSSAALIGQLGRAARAKAELEAEAAAIVPPNNALELSGRGESGNADRAEPR